VLGMLYKIEMSEHPEWESELVSERDLASAMVEGYVEWVAAEGMDAGLEVVAAERDVQVPLPGVPGVMLRARLDQLVRRSDGVFGFLDFKTAATFDKREMLALDPQMKTYSLVQQLLTLIEPEETPLVKGGYMTTLRRVKRSSRSQPPYYQRDEFWYTPEQIEACRLRITQLVREILHARWVLDGTYEGTGGSLDAVNEVQRTELRPVPILSDCRWSCDFVTLCPMMDDGSDWPGVLTQSGRFTQEDPYEYYRRDALRTVRAELAKL
jgi:hypothetical protein